MGYATRAFTLVVILGLVACSGGSDNDGSEQAASNETSQPESPNEGDGINDGDEVAGGSSPTNPCDPDADNLACPTGDPDGDGLPTRSDPCPYFFIGSSPQRTTVRALPWS